MTGGTKWPQGNGGADRTPGRDGTDAAPGRGYSWYVVGVLIVAYTFSYIDRTILSLMVDPIRATLRISDVQISLLHGLAFAIFYTVLGIPIGRQVDRRRRTAIVAVGIALWSIATTACGFARSFGTMFAARIGVGVGEAALSPSAYSLIADCFTGKRLVRALSVYQCAIYLGPAIAAGVVGLLLSRLEPSDTTLGHLEPWQQVFVAVGAPGVLVAALVATLREPRRRGPGSATAPPSFAAVIAHMRGHARAYGLLILGYACASVMWNGATAWLPTHFHRAYGWSTALVASRYGPAFAACGMGGILTGSWLAGRMRDAGRPEANIRLGVVSAATACAFIVAAPLTANGWTSFALTCGFLFCGAMPYGGAAAALQEITPNRMRGQVSAIYLFGLNVAGIGAGPTIVALTTHALGGDAMVGRAVVIVCGTAAIASAGVLLACGSHYRQALVAPD